MVCSNSLDAKFLLRQSEAIFPYLKWWASPQPTQYVGPMLIQCWSTVYDAGPTLDQHTANVLCLLGQLMGHADFTFHPDRIVPCACLTTSGVSLSKPSWNEYLATAIHNRLSTLVCINDANDEYYFVPLEPWAHTLVQVWIDWSRCRMWCRLYPIYWK